MSLGQLLFSCLASVCLIVHPVVGEATDLVQMRLDADTSDEPNCDGVKKGEPGYFTWSWSDADESWRKTAVNCAEVLQYEEALPCSYSADQRIHSYISVSAYPQRAETTVTADVAKPDCPNKCFCRPYTDVAALRVIQKSADAVEDLMMKEDGDAFDNIHIGAKDACVAEAATIKNKKGWVHGTNLTEGTKIKECGENTLLNVPSFLVGLAHMEYSDCSALQGHADTVTISVTADGQLYMWILEVDGARQPKQLTDEYLVGEGWTRVMASGFVDGLKRNPIVLFKKTVLSDSEEKLEGLSGNMNVGFVFGGC